MKNKKSPKLENLKHSEVLDYLSGLADVPRENISAVLVVKITGRNLYRVMDSSRPDWSADLALRQSHLDDFETALLARYEPEDETEEDVEPATLRDQSRDATPADVEEYVPREINLDEREDDAESEDDGACDYCGGTGYDLDADDGTECPECDGTGDAPEEVQ